MVGDAWHLLEGWRRRVKQLVWGGNAVVKMVPRGVVAQYPSSRCMEVVFKNHEQARGI